MNPYDKIKKQLAMSAAAILAMVAPGAGVSTTSRKDEDIPCEATVQKLKDIVNIKAEDSILLEERTYAAVMSVNPFDTPLPPQNPESAIPRMKPEWAYLDNLEVGQTKEMALAGITPTVVKAEERPDIAENCTAPAQLVTTLSKDDNPLDEPWVMLRLSKEEGLDGGIHFLDEDVAESSDKTLSQSIEDTKQVLE
jgi:hypothetical protein